MIKYQVVSPHADKFVNANKLEKISHLNAQFIHYNDLSLNFACKLHEPFNIHVLSNLRLDTHGRASMPA